MAEISLLSLPPEIIYRIFDFSDFETILFCIRRVCKQLFNAVNLYNRLLVSLNPKQQKILKPLLPILQPENVIGLSLTNKSGTNMVQMLCSLFCVRQFTRLSSLSLHGIKDTELQQILDSLKTNCLTSIIIESSEKEHSNTWKLISLVLRRANLQNLCAPNMNYKMEYFSWPVQYGLQKLEFRECNYAEYLVIIDQLPSLQTLIMENCIMKDTDYNPSTSSPVILHSSLNSLTINNGSFSSQKLELLLDPIPELRHLRLISKYRKFDCMFDGCRWEQIIQMKLPHLKKLEFFLSCFTAREGNTYRIEPIMATFRTPFWLNEKQWSVCCSFGLSGSIISLFTTPINIPYEKSIRFEVSSIDDTCRLTSRSFNARIDNASTEMIGELFLRQEMVDWRGAQYLRIILQGNTTITKLDLGQNNLDNRGVQYLSDVLRQDVTLKTLNLHENGIGDVGAEFIADVLKQNKTLTSLDLGTNKIGEIGMKYLNDALRQNTTLTKLDLGNNQIRDKGAEYVADVLKNNKSITELNLTVNKIGEHGARHLADGLRNNTMLTRLSLGYNSIGKTGAKYLAESLLENTTLIILEIGRNEIGNEGTKYLADVLKHNTTLATLDLQVNNIDDEGAQCLIDTLNKNKTIQVITLYSNELSFKLKSKFSTEQSRIQC